jgi:hypothetical protein
MTDRELISTLLEALKEIATRGPVDGYYSADALRLRLIATQAIARAAIAKASEADRTHRLIVTLGDADLTREDLRTLRAVLQLLEATQAPPAKDIPPAARARLHAKVKAILKAPQANPGPITSNTPGCPHPHP